jgi:hypothetical protein
LAGTIRTVSNRFDSLKYLSGIDSQQKLPRLPVPQKQEALVQYLDPFEDEHCHSKRSLQPLAYYPSIKEEQELSDLENQYQFNEAEECQMNAKENSLFSFNKKLKQANQ